MNIFSFPSLQKVVSLYINDPHQVLTKFPVSKYPKTFCEDSCLETHNHFEAPAFSLQSEPSRIKTRNCWCPILQPPRCSSGTHRGRRSTNRECYMSSPLRGLASWILLGGSTTVFVGFLYFFPILWLSFDVFFETDTFLDVIISLAEHREVSSQARSVL